MDIMEYTLYSMEFLLQVADVLATFMVRNKFAEATDNFNRYRAILINIECNVLSMCSLFIQNTLFNL